jgi:hypothetical protein
MKALIAFLAITFTCSVSAEDLYKTGNEALKKEDYVTALKYLFAYRTLKSEELNKHPDFLRTLDASISTAESKLRSTQLSTVGKGVGFLGVAGAKGSATPFTNTATTVSTRGYEVPELLRALDAKGLKVVPQSAEGKKYLEELIKDQEKQLLEMKSAAQFYERPNPAVQGTLRDKAVQR